MSTFPVSRTMVRIWLLGAALAAGACEGRGPVDPVAPAAVTIQPQSVSLFVGQRVQLRSYPDDLTCQWSSSQPTVATVTPGGQVIARSVGTAVVTMTMNEGTATTTVTVMPGKLPPE